MWLAWIVGEKQDDTPLPLVASPGGDLVAWLTIGVDAPSYETLHGPVTVADLASALAWAEGLGLYSAPEGG